MAHLPITEQIPTYNIYRCFLRDPNGYWIEIQRFLDPQSSKPQDQG